LSRMKLPDQAPQPSNPYSVFAVLTGGLGILGIIALERCGWEPSRAHPIAFITGVMGLTTACLLAVGVAYGWLGFEKRFGQERLVAYWETGDGDWREHSRKQRKRILRTGIWLMLGSPLVVVLVMLALAFTDGKVVGTLPFAFVIGGLISLVFGVVTVLQLFSLSGSGGRVWLVEKGVMVNGNVFFSDGYGIRMLSYEIGKAEGGLLLTIRYEVRSGRAVGEQEMAVPVPEDKAGLVEETVRGW